MRVMVGSYERLIELCPQSLTFEDIEMILKRMKAPLHPNALKNIFTPQQGQYGTTPESISHNLETMIDDKFTSNAN